MSSSYYHVSEYVIPCQHIREYPRATRTRKDEQLRLAIKHYVPTESRGGAVDHGVTIIATHAVGLPKEAYEPLWDDLFHLSRKHDFTIRGIWAADTSNQGASGVMNEDLLGEDTNYFDHSRDLLQMVNVFRDQMIRPIIGIGHSFGATQLVGLASMHPRLMAGAILMEPIIRQQPPPGMNVSRPSSFRGDIWPSLSAATAAIRGNKFFAGLDPRVVEIFLKYGIRKLPTALYPVSQSTKEGSYTLTTSKHQEVWSFQRANFEGVDPASSRRREDYVLFPDINDVQRGHLFYRGEINVANEYLPHVRPSVLYIFGGKSYLSSAESQNDKMARTGTGTGGNGGARIGQVQKHVFPELSHMAPLEDVGESAKVIGAWIENIWHQFQQDEKTISSFDTQASENNNMAVISKKWLELVKLPMPLKKSKL